MYQDESVVGERLPVMRMCAQTRRPNATKCRAWRERWPGSAAYARESALVCWERDPVPIGGSSGTSMAVQPVAIAARGATESGASPPPGRRPRGTGRRRPDIPSAVGRHRS